ncbi:Cleavage stimulating factor 64 [Nymphaea thermarum]|nr:Cleavage stimulating factor 64 [Nymphaea thermarum]
MAANVGANFSASQKQNAGDSFTAHLAGMSKNQLYDVMSQMKNLIEQNPSQARQILVANPSLTKALFQAQIMLGMVQPPQVMPNIPQAASQQPQQSSSLGLQPSAQARPSISANAAVQGQSSTSQPQVQNRQQPSVQSSVPMSSSLLTPPIQPVQAAQHAQTYLNVQTSSISHPQPSQNVPILSHHAASQSTVLQPQVLSSQLQTPMLNPGALHQPPLPQQPRPSIQPFPHQLQPPMPPTYGFQSSNAPQQLSQPLYQAGIGAPSSLGNSFPQGPPTLPGQPPLMKPHQVGSHISGDLGSQNASSMQIERGSGVSWMSAAPESSISGVQLPGAPATVAGQMSAIGQAARPSQLSPEIEKALLQQVMSLTPEQINLLPPEQRQQVLQLQQMLRLQDISTASV